MSEKRRGLGRGLGALIPSSASAGARGMVSRPPVLWIYFFLRRARALNASGSFT